MARNYYILVSRAKTLPGGWEIEFSDYDHECVVFEKDDLRYRHPDRRYHILVAYDSNQATIDRLVRKLNTVK